MLSRDGVLCVSGYIGSADTTTTETQRLHRVSFDYCSDLRRALLTRAIGS
jgi:hypothetical protein